MKGFLLMVLGWALSPIHLLFAVCDRVESYMAAHVGRALLERVDLSMALRAVKHPAGPVLDVLTRHARGIEDVAVGTCLAVMVPLLVMLGVVAQFNAVIVLSLARDPGGYVVFLVIAALWAVPALAAALASVAALSGALRGTHDLVLLYQQAQTVEWAKRYPGQSYWHMDWTYSRT